MKKYLLLITCFPLFAVNIYASYSIDWIKPADDYLKTGTMVARDKSDNVVVVGYIQSENTYTRKFDKFGNLLWEKVSTSGIDNNYEKPLWVNCDKNKNIYVTGYRYSIFDGWDYPNAVVVLKYNSNGVLLWKQTVDISYIFGPMTGMKFNLRSDVDTKGNLYIATACTTPSGFVLIKMSNTGSVLVNTVVNLSTIHGFSSMRLMKDRVIATGTSSLNQNLSVVVWDTAGTLIWTTTIEDAFTGIDVEMDAMRNAYVLTHYPDQVSATSGNDLVIYKYNATGVLKWKKAFDFGGEELATRFTLVSGKLSIIGYGNLAASYLDWIIFQTNTNGVKLWDARYNKMSNNDEIPYFLAANASGEVFVTGKGGPPYVVLGSSYLRMVTAKYGNTGTMQWADTTNVYSGWGIACTLASDSSLFVVSTSKMTAFHYLDHTGTGSCGIPSPIAVTAITDTSAKFTWAAVPGAYLYHLRYKTAAAADWTTISTNATTIKIKTFSAGTEYQYAIESICSSGPSGYGVVQSFTTTGIGYCSTGGLSTENEYLTMVWIEGIMCNTVDNNGYADFTNLSTDLTHGETIYGYLQAVLPFYETEYYSIWIDYNQNNSFSDPGELAVNISSIFMGWIAVNFTVPATADLGPTRMRVTMQYGGAPEPCGEYARGETEDYTVNIVPVGRTHEINAINDFNPQIFPNPFINDVSIVIDDNDLPVTMLVFDVTGKLCYESVITNTLSEFNWSDLNAGNYYVKLITKNNTSAVLKVVK